MSRLIVHATILSLLSLGSTACYAANGLGWLALLEMVTSKQDKSSRYVYSGSVDLHHLIEKQAVATGVPERLIAAVIMTESYADPCAVSSAGAVGVMQLMKQTAREIDPAIDRFNPVDNVRGGARYLRIGLDRTRGNWQQAAAFYNGGPTTLGKKSGQWFRETREYAIEKIPGWLARFQSKGDWRKVVPKRIRHTNWHVCNNLLANKR
ncbi:MAG: lytic transglycosylase domain-containing protein [Sedimenticola sp.]